MTLDEVIERAARELPEGFIISLSVEHGSSWVIGYRPDGSPLIIDGADQTLAEQVSEAIKQCLNINKA